MQYGRVTSALRTESYPSAMADVTKEADETPDSPSASVSRAELASVAPNLGSAQAVASLTAVADAMKATRSTGHVGLALSLRRGRTRARCFVSAFPTLAELGLCADDFVPVPTGDARQRADAVSPSGISRSGSTIQQPSAVKAFGRAERSAEVEHPVKCRQCQARRCDARRGCRRTRRGAAQGHLQCH